MSKMSDSKDENVKAMTEDVFGVNTAKDSIMTFNDLMGDENGFIGKESDKKNPFSNNNKSKDDRYFDALIGNNKEEKLVEEKSEQEIIDSILASNQRFETKQINKRRGFTAPKTSTGTSNYTYKPSTRASSTNSSKDWRSQFEKENKDFFNSPSANFEENTNTKKEELRTDNEIYAVVFGNQKITDKGRVRMRLAKDAYINGVKHKRNTLVFGFAKFSKNRVFIDVHKINDIDARLFVYDAQDYNKGLNSKKDFSYDASEEVQDDAIDEINVGKIPLGNTVKKLFKKKNKVNYAVLENNSMLTFKPF